jgi:hypothetical protein
MSIGEHQVTAGSTRRRNANAIARATAQLAGLLERIESGEKTMSPSTVRELEDATRVLEDLVAEVV